VVDSRVFGTTPEESALWSGPLPPHTLENVGNTELRGRPESFPGIKLPEGCLVDALVKRESFSSVWLPGQDSNLQPFG
jgi:hypothetical protein